ncbi:MAG: hypothetical protein AB1597_04305 [Chloroflexota bacterium]
MNDSTLQWSLTAATIVIALLVIAAIASGWLWPLWAILAGIVIEAAVAVPLLYLWGKDYMSRS